MTIVQTDPLEVANKTKFVAENESASATQQSWFKRTIAQLRTLNTIVQTASDRHHYANK